MQRPRLPSQAQQMVQRAGQQPLAANGCQPRLARLVQGRRQLPADQRVLPGQRGRGVAWPAGLLKQAQTSARLWPGAGAGAAYRGWGCAT